MKKIIRLNPPIFRPSIKKIISLLIAITIFTFLGVRAYPGIQEIIRSGLRFREDYLIISFLCQLVGVLLAAWMWNNILKKVGINTGYLFDLATFCASAIARKIPGTLWYAVGRVTMYSARYMSKSLVIIALVIEAIVISMGGVVAFVFSVTTGDFSPSWLNKDILLFIFLPGSLIVTILLGPVIIHKLVKRASKGKNILITEQTRITNTTLWLIGETSVVLFASGVAYFFIKSLQPDLNIPFTAILGALSLSVMLGPVTVWLPGDIGLKDGFVFLALNPFLPDSFAALATLAFRIWLSILEISMGFIAGLFLYKQTWIAKPGISND